MPLQGEYLGMDVHIDDLDIENRAFFEHCGSGTLHLQQCDACGLKRFPPTTACPFCSHIGATWQPVSGLGTVYSYGQVHHAIQPVFRAYAPYLLLLVELDEQRDEPKPYDGLRVQGNLATADGEMAPPELVARVGIGSRVRVVFNPMGEGLAMPLWTLDEAADQPASPWRYDTAYNQ